MATASLEISPEVVGARSAPLEIEITPRMIMNYAAAIDDANPWHFADDWAEGIVAPPMMTWALTWRFSTYRDEYWGDAGISAELAARGVHYTEALEWARPLRPGDRLTIEGEIVKLQAHRAGTVATIEYVGTDADGARVFTEQIGSLLRDVTCSGEIEAYPSESGGDSETPVRTVRLPIHPLAAHVYDGCADIHNPIHTSKAFAQMVGLPDIILHGTATLAYAVREITNTEGDADPTRVKRIGCTFTGMVFPGTEVELQVLGSDDGAVRFQVLDALGKKAIRNGVVALGG